MNSNWVSARSSGFDGFRCNKCATWRYANQSLICACPPVKPKSIKITLSVPVVDRGNFDMVTRSFEGAARGFSLFDLEKILKGTTVISGGVCYELVD